MGRFDIGQRCGPFFATTVMTKEGIFGKKLLKPKANMGNCDMGNGTWQAMGMQTV